MKRSFVEAPVFTMIMKKIGDPDLLLRIQKEILENLEVGDVVEGTGGVRKFRVAKEGSGKSGGFRVFYLDLPQIEITHLLHILDKKVLANISDTGKAFMKKETKKLKERK